MSLAPRADPLPSLLGRLEAELESGTAHRVRVLRKDGSIVDGHLNEASHDSLTVLVGRAEDVTAIEANDVSALAVGRVSRNKEGIVAIAAIIGGVGAMVGWASLPWVDASSGGAAAAFTMVAALAGAGYAAARRWTRLGAWLVRWEWVYRRGAT